VKANATLLCDHFVWDAGTRVRVVAYWVSEANVTIQFPPCEKQPNGGRWTMTAKAVQLDPGVKLKVEGKAEG
jgi:hypothetical protein